MMYDLGFIGGMIFFLCATVGVVLAVQITPGFWKAAQACFVAAFAGAILMVVTLIYGITVVVFGL